MGQVYNISLAIFCAIGSFLFGYDSGIISSVITLPAFKSFVNNPKNYDSLSGAVVSTFTGGCFFGAATAGWTNDKFGRIRTVQLGVIIALWGCAMQSGANNFACMLIGRIVAGFAIGVLSMTVPLYNTEIAPPKYRGFIVGLTQQMIGIGFIVANWVGYGCQFLKGNVQWRLPLGLQLAPAALLLLGSFFMPQSPRWLLEHDRDDEARRVVHTLHGSSASAQEEADVEFAEMRETIKAEVLVRSRSITDLWATRGMLRRTFVAVGVQVFGQFSGINVINYFGPSMYRALGLSAGQSLLVQGIYGAVGPITNFFFITLILDTVGRKKPLMFGAGSFVVTYSVLTAIVASFPPDESTNLAAQRAGIAMIFLTSIFFSLSFGPVSWVLASEVFPTRTRSIGTSVATCANWAFNVLFSQVSNIAITNISWRYYLVFIVLNAIDFIIIGLFFPETKGLTLEQMAELFGDEVDAHDVLQCAAAHEKLNHDHLETEKA
ncbi:general substrate transporter [Dichomitus squalens]|uniref:General substrate transporter n=1 Tax=Dichomitus squalens TaxID=114155 RepID=A0A4Q9P943_9APHY|nr:general substrate transporter [Dichomitus squalens LYAD-421 SS1]EJF64770.1 general substrate transporter [Dichomitus squalens LYAD-421 SS1]TBU50385.1 general substrate transporter [Dichomitus squalens]TBU62924.1 general substrate transporter [Dichomitus squalens]